MPLKLDPTTYGFNDVDDLARALGTLQGEAGNQDLRGRAMILDLALNRTTANGYPYNSYRDAAGNTYTGVSAQLATPSQFSTWLPREAGAYASATSMYNLINRIGADPALYDRLSPSMQAQVNLNLAAARGVLGTGDLRGVAGDATYYSTGNRGSYSDRTWNEHQGYGLGTAMQAGKVGGEYWYGGDAANTKSINDKISSFDWDGQSGKLLSTYDPNLQKIIKNPPLPPARPSDQALGIDNGGVLDRFSDSLTSGLQSAAQGIASQYQAAVGRLPSLDELKGAVSKLGDGTASFFDSLRGIATSPEADAYAQSQGLPTGIYAPSRSTWGTDSSSSPYDYEPVLGHITYGSDASTAPSVPPYTPNTGTAYGSDASTGGAGSYNPFIDPYGFSKAQVGSNGGASGIQPAQPDASTFTPSPISAPDLPSFNPIQPLGALILDGTGFSNANVSQGVQPGQLKNFDPSWYLSANPDVQRVAQQQGLDPNSYALSHYLNYGQKEGRAFAPGETLGQGFDAQAYLTKNADVASVAAQQGLNPLQYALEHYVTHGVGEGRQADVSPYGFSATNLGMGSQYGGVGAGSAYTPNGFGLPGSASSSAPSVGPYDFSNANVSQGIGNGKLSDFNAAWYLDANPDVAAVAKQQGLDPKAYALDHFISNGQKEGRAFAPGEWLSGSFNPGSYLAQNSDVAGVAASQALDPNSYALRHFLTYGVGEGRSGAGASVSPTAFSSSAIGTAGGLGNGTPDTFSFTPSTFTAPSLSSVTVPTAIPPGTGPYDFSSANVSQGQPNGSLSNFDASWYLSQNPDVLQAAKQRGTDPNSFALSQYLSDGSKEGRAFAPNEWLSGSFDPSSYILANPDVGQVAQQQGIDPQAFALQHLITNGIGENRSLGDGSTASMLLSRYKPGSFNLVGSEQALQTQAASAALGRMNTASNQALQTNLGNLAANPNAVTVPEPGHADPSGAFGAAVNGNAASNYALSQALAKISAPLPAVQPVQQSFYGAQPKTGLFGGSGPPGSGFL